MCRIAGIVSGRMAAPEMRAKVGLMCAALQHGGPDDEGLFIDEQAQLVFGHRRLAIIDLSKNGHQPMADFHQRAWITFNGEIYNYTEIRQELQESGVRFNSLTDTEVILNAYLKWGTGAFSKFRGMFAFALYDKAKMLTYLVRDATGIKPLYYKDVKGQLSFASEVRAFRAAGIAGEADANWQIRFLAHGNIPEPYTTLKDIYSLPKGHFLVWDLNKGDSKIVPYQVAAADSIIMDARLAKEKIVDVLTKAVNRQLLASDAPIGVFLSGGIDSSIIALLANEEQRQALKTISIYFNEKAYDESAYQHVVLDKIGGEKFVHLVQQQDFEKYFPTIIADMDMPTTDGINSWFISKYAHDDGLKAALSGLGADELFGGYPSFNRIRYLKYLRSLPPGILRGAANLKADKYRKVSFLANQHFCADYLLLRGLFVSADIAKILDTDVRNVEEVLFEGNPSRGPGSYNEESAAWFEQNLYMQNQLLRDTDVMSMSHGLEVRVPFLDEDFQCLANSISPLIRFDRKQPKKLLIDSFSDILPQSVWKRHKMGFSFPLQQWMSEHTAIGNESLYPGKISRDLIVKFKTGQMHWSKAFALYQIHLHG